MRTILLGPPSGLTTELRDAVRSHLAGDGITMELIEHAEPSSLSGPEKAELFEDPNAIACVWIDGLSTVSLFMSCLTLLLEGSLGTLIAFTEVSLDVPLKYGDAWEVLRVEELRESGKLLIIESSDKSTVQTLVDLLTNQCDA